MVVLVSLPVLRTGQDWLDFEIRDMMLRGGDAGGGPVLFARAGPGAGDGLAVWQLGASGAGAPDWRLLPGGQEGGLRATVLLDLGTGVALRHAASDQSSGQLSGVLTGAAPVLGAATAWTGLSADQGPVTALARGPGALLFLAGADLPGSGTHGLGGAIHTYRDMGGGVLEDLAVTRGDAGRYLGAPADLCVVTPGADSFLLAMDVAGRGVSSFLVGPSGTLTQRGQMGAQQGLGVMVPVALETAVLDGGAAFAVLASAAGGGGSAALSVLQLRADGSLKVTDHVLDTLATRFGQVQDLAVVASGGRAYVIAAGGDDGISLFALTGAGRLVHLDSIAAGTLPGLDATGLLEAARIGDMLQIFLAGPGQAGIAQFALSLASEGEVLTGSAAADQLAGGGLDDILDGGAGNDLLTGGQGDDILIDGPGRDTLSGGAGRDIFLLSADGVTDRVQGFEPGLDRLDLSGFPMLYDPAQLTFVARSDGADLIWRGEVTELRSAAGGALSLQDIFAAGSGGPDRPPLIIGETVSGGFAADRLDGHAGDDLLSGGDGNDTLTGFEGYDTLMGGNGYDSLHGGPGDDLVLGGNGCDFIRLGQGDDLFRDTAQGGVHGADTVMADAGNDTVLGQGGDDEFHGHAGDDLLKGGDGADQLFGGDGFDTLRGGNGDDTVVGGNGRDLVFLGQGDDLFRDNAQGGAAGADTVHAGAGADRVEGGAGDEVIHGNGGNDRLFGRKGNDRLFGGDQDDTLIGGDGDDHVAGGRGRDRAFLGAGNDRYVDTTQSDQFGRDRVFGGAGNDTIDGGGGDDTLTGGAGADVFVFRSAGGDRVVTDFSPGTDQVQLDLGAVAQADSPHGALFSWDGGSLLLEDVLLSDLGGGDILILG